MTKFDHLPPIVDSRWLRLALEEQPGHIAICDVRTTMSSTDPTKDYLSRHLPDAHLVLLDSMLAVEPAGTDGRHPLPTPDQFASALGALAIGNNTTVIAYDDHGGAFAGRLVWMLRIIGQPAALLDGGLDDWDGDVASGPVSAERIQRDVIEWPIDAVADADQVVEHIAVGGIVIDSRAAERYEGKVEPIDAVAGHVPGAINVVFGENLGPEGRFLAPAQLAERFSQPEHDPRTIVYCGSGVTACHNALAMEYAGLGLPRVYVGSWSGWSFDPDRPIATGPAPR